MKKIYSTFSTLIILSSCFNNNSNDYLTVDSNIGSNSGSNSDINIDEEILKEEKKLQELEKISDNEIDELINTIVE